MKRILLFALICAILSATHLRATRLCAQPLPDRMAVKGRVVDASGKAIGGAAVTLRRQVESGAMGFWGDITYTDARGDFGFADAEEGTFGLSVEAAGFASIQYRTQILTANMAPLKITLVLTASVPIRFVAPDGSPIKEQMVAIALSSNEGALLSLRPRTDANGATSAAGLTPGTYRLEALVPDKGYADVRQIELKSGANATLDVTLKIGGTLRVEAREEPVGEVKGRTVGGVTIALVQSGPEAAKFREWMYISTDADRIGKLTRDGDGITEFTNVPPATYDVTARHELSGTAGAKATVEVKAGEIAQAEILFKAAGATVAQLQVTVKNAEGAVVPNSDYFVTAQMIAASDEKPAIAPDAPAKAAPDRILNASLRRARTDAEGRFVLYPLPLGKWKITLRGTNEGAKDTTTAAVDVPAAGAAVDAMLVK